MHFRVRKNVVQLIRTHYDPERKRPKTTVVGKMALAHPELEPALAQQLSPAEIAEATAWIQQHNRLNLLREELAALTLADSLSLANQWFRRQGDNEAAQRAAANLGRELAALRKTLKAINLLT